MAGGTLRWFQTLTGLTHLRLLPPDLLGPGGGAVSNPYRANSFETGDCGCKPPEGKVVSNPYRANSFETGLAEEELPLPGKFQTLTGLTHLRHWGCPGEGPSSPRQFQTLTGLTHLRRRKEELWRDLLSGFKPLQG